MYQEKFGFMSYDRHPLKIYSSPYNGHMYFIENMHLKSFGFPRLSDVEKKVKWKKMNFTTDLPKINPQVKYLVATGKLNKVCYRMHVVVLASKYDRKDSAAKVQDLMKSPDDRR